MDFKDIKLSKALSYTLRSLPRGKSHPKSIVHSCNLPFTHVSVDSNSDCFLCQCDGWLPIPVGKVEDFQTLDEVWNSSVAKMLQKDIDEKKYTWCAIEHCGITKKNIVNSSPYTLSISIDDSCNLACPSCRRELRMLDKGPIFDKKQKDLEQVLQWLDRFEKPITISLGGTGDALASQLCRNFIKKYQHKENQKFLITTNGLLLKKVITGSSIQSAISTYIISVDAGSADVYENVRRPGKWSVLMENLDWISTNRQHSTIVLSFVLQKTNFRDLPAFVELCQKFNFYGQIRKLDDWGTWNSKPVKDPDTYTIQNGTFLDHDVCNVEHPEHEEFLSIFRHQQTQNLEFITYNAYFDRFK
jgi:hypothetical protein